MDMERVNPIEIECNGTVYKLDFDKESVMWAEDHGLVIDDINTKTMSVMSNLFFFAFRKHHPNMTKIQTNRIMFDEMGGLPVEVLERLTQLYTVNYNALVQTEETAKNSKWTVRM